MTTVRTSALFMFREQALAGYPPEDLLDCDTFRAVDGILIKWITERLLAEDTGANLNGLAIPDVCESFPPVPAAAQSPRNPQSGHSTGKTCGTPDPGGSQSPDIASRSLGARL